MSIGDYCERPAATVRAGESVRAAAQRMKLAGVGSLIVVEGDRPVGIVSDRDLVLGALCKRLDTGALRVEEVASRPLATIHRDAPVREAIRLMKRRAIRRLPVVDDKGALVGIVSADDLTTLAVGELSGLAVAIAAQTPPSDAQRSES
jgi:CBS domain-containing protein